MPGIEKILKGILRYRSVDRVKWVERFQQLKEKPETSTLVFSCMDSRVLLSKFAYGDIGESFIVRNAGNFVPNCKNNNSVSTEAGALELACVINNIGHVVVCGHSDCKAINLLYDLKNEASELTGTPLSMWVKKHGLTSLEKFQKFMREGSSGFVSFQGATDSSSFQAYIDPHNELSETDKFSQINCLQQLENISSYPFMNKKLSSNKVILHALWYDIHSGEVLMFSRERKCFVAINDNSFSSLLKEANKRNG